MRPFAFLLTISLLILSINSFSQPSCVTNVTNVSCAGLSDGAIDLTVTGGQPPYVYEWLDPNNVIMEYVEDQEGLFAGTYNLVVTDDNNETCENMVFVSEPSPLLVDIEVESINCYENITLTGNGSGGVFPYTYEWNTGETTQTINVYDAGVYTLNIIDNNACVGIETYNYVESPAPCDTIHIIPTYENVGDLVRVDFPFDDFEMISSFEFSMDYDPAALQLESFGLFNVAGLNASNFTNPYPGKITVSWADPVATGITLPDGTSTHSIYFIPLTTDESIFEVTSDPIFPVFFSEVTTEVAAWFYYPLTIVPDADVVCVESTITNVTCFNGEDGCIDVEAVFGSAPYTYQWSNSATTAEICNLTVGNYSVTVTDNNNETCVRDFTVGQPEAPLNTTIELFTFECSPVFLDVEVEGGTPNFTFQWSDGVTSQNHNNIIPGNMYGLTVTDALGCEATSAIFVPINVCDSVYIQPVQATVGNQIRIDFEVEKFDLITGLDFTMFYDASALEYVEAGNFGIASMTSSNFTQDTPGSIEIDWEEITNMGQTLPDGSVVYSLYFNSLGNFSSTLAIGDWPYEIANASGLWLELLTDPLIVVGNGNLIQGTVYFDENDNCVNDGEFGFFQQAVTVTDGVNLWNVATTSDGSYSIVLPNGTYDVNFNPFNSNIWTTCEDSYTVELSGADTEVLDIGVQALLDCAAMEVDIAIPVLTRCFLNPIYVEYCNYGSISAEDAFIEIQLDPFMALTLTANSPQPTAVNDNTYTYELGDVGVGECGSFHIYVELDPFCTETDLGQTHCVIGTVYPNEPCEINPLWSGASLMVTGSCDGENVNFLIENVGTSNMVQASSFIVIEDQVMGQSIPEDFILGAGESLIVTHPANGSTYRVILNQVPYHPGNSVPSVAVEGCGVNDNGEISLGMVTMFNEGDGDGFEDIECLENTGSYDPNDKRATVTGFGEENYIYANEQMEYIIRFQNTGTAVAFNVEIKDELSPNFDITSIRPGASSHSYTYSIEDERTMVFIFDNIMLPDSTTDLENSQGFISYKVDQLLDNPDGTMLENSADIYFDFNPPITTNTTHHEIGSDFVTTSTFFDEKSGEQNSISVYPNPSTDLITFELEEMYDDLELEVYDITGRLLITEEFANEKIVLSKNALNEGMYFYSIKSKGKQLTSGKFIFL